MHVIDVDIAPPGADPELHDEQLRARIIAACEEHGEVELRYPNGIPDIARLEDGALVVTAT
jgi:hypothetical protein